MTHHIDIQVHTTSGDLFQPSDVQLEAWANAALAELNEPSEMTLCLVSIEEIQTLNLTYRHKDKPTNVLSFPADIPDEVGLSLLGDVVICASVVAKEAEEQQKTLESHWAHMVIHGGLHLLGYDHENDEDAEVMEVKEIEILGQFGYPNPYVINEGNIRT